MSKGWDGDVVNFLGVALEVGSDEVDEFFFGFESESADAVGFDAVGDGGGFLEGFLWVEGDGGAVEGEASSVEGADAFGFGEGFIGDGHGAHAKAGDGFPEEIEDGSEDDSEGDEKFETLIHSVRDRLRTGEQARGKDEEREGKFRDG